MKLKLLRLLIMTIKLSTYGLVCQVLFMSVLYAHNGIAQYKKVSEVVINQNVNGLTIEEAFDLIERNSQLELSYLKKDLDQKVRVKLNSRKHWSVYDILMDISRQSNLKFRQVNNAISVSSVQNRGATNSFERIMMVREVDISGKVLDENGQGLPGASIVIKETTNGTTSDLEGNYKLSVSENAVLVISFVGYISQEVSISGRRTIDIQMEPDAAQLGEVVVVGYGIQDRNTVAGAVGQISGEVLQERPITNTLNGLQGTVPGLTITRNSGQPGNEGYNLNIRGLSSLNSGNSPLVLIDGVEGDMNLLNPNDIETVSVLKDASAAIYGARAAGGVILITTKSGKNGQPIKVNYSANYSINKVANLLDRVNLREWVEMDWEAKNNAGASPQFFNTNVGNNTLEDVLAKIDAGAEPDHIGGTAYLFYKDARWNNRVFDSGTQQYHNLNVSGGSNASRYNVSLGYQDTEGIFSNAYDNSKRMNVRLNYGFDITDKFKVDTRLSYVNQKSESPSIGASTALDLLNRIFIWLPERTESGQYATQWGFGNPRQALDKEIGKSTSINEVIRGNITGSYQILDGLRLNGQVAVDRALGTTDSYINRVPRFSYNDVAEGFAVNRNSASKGFNERNYLNLTGYIDYNTTFGDAHEITVTAGVSHEQNQNDYFSAWRYDFTQTELFTLNLGDANEQFNNAGASDWTIRSLFGRATYVYDSRYIVELNYRRDGTSVFAPAKRWGNFAGYSLAWRASEETFIQNLNVFDNLKVRFSRGTTGNQNLNSGNLYDYIALINFGGAYPFGDGVQSQSASERAIVSQSRTWENLKTTNIGLDFAILDAKLSGSFDWFQKENNNMLLGVNLPSVLGGVPPAQNIGSLKTEGFELSLTWSENTDSGLSYSITGILSDNQNKLINLNGRDQVNLGNNFSREGYALNTYFGYMYDGVIESQDELDEYKQLEGVPSNLDIGDAKYKDLNNDGRISIVDEEGNDADIVTYGDNSPRYSYALNTNVSYKGFDLGVFVQGVAQRTVYYTDQWRLPFEQPWWQPLRRFYGDTWSPENTGAKYPRLTTGSQRYWNYQTSANTKINGAYLRVKNITLGYTLPESLLQNLGIEKVRLFFSGEDLITLSSVDGGYDPENTNGSANFYPFTKRYSVGLNVNF